MSLQVAQVFHPITGCIQVSYLQMSRSGAQNLVNRKPDCRDLMETPMKTY